MELNLIIIQWLYKVNILKLIHPLLIPYESAKDNLKELDDIFDIPLDAFKVETNQTDLFVGTLSGTNLLLW
jgi:hypothetical protein